MIKHMVAAAAILGSATAANAATFVFVGGSGAVLPGETVIAEFNDPSQDGIVTSDPSLPNPDFVFITPPPNTSQGAAPAFGDGSRFLSVIANGTAFIDFAPGGVAGFSFDFGSADDFNILTIRFVGGGSQSFNGDQLITGDANGNQGAALTNGRLRVFADPGQTIAGITLQSQGANAFEIDRLATTAVPEPATWGMMILGFGIVGAAMRRRSSTTRVFA